MGKFYVNVVCGETITKQPPYGQMIIGLFKQCKSKGVGNFCGYYANEYYINTEMYAYYIADCNGVYKPEARISEVTFLEQPIKYNEIQIGSHMWTKVIEAESIEEAVELFAEAKWRRWGYPEDEF